MGGEDHGKGLSENDIFRSFQCDRRRLRHYYRLFCHYFRRNDAEESEEDFVLNGGFEEILSVIKDMQGTKDMFLHILFIVRPQQK